MSYLAGEYDVIVIGAGHAGCEAALASARMGCRTLMVTLNMDNVALTPCNPSIGGPAKSHLVREIDALGGEMAVNTDRSMVQVRMLNTGKGPAVHALRAQLDRKMYQLNMMKVVENQPDLWVKKALIEDILLEDGKIAGAVSQTGAIFRAPQVIITSGTYLNSRIIIGDVIYEGAPDNQFPAKKLSYSLREHGIELRRFKTGTPSRIERRSVDFSQLQLQPGDEPPECFSFISEPREMEQMPCWLAYTNEETHKVIKDNLDRSPLFSGVIEGTGPRYCPSIEDKVVRFSDKPRHQLFIEPEGKYVDEMYVQGMSSSLPEDVQIAMLRTIKGLENCEVVRSGYAIEYDCIDARQLNLNLESKQIEGLFFAGQVNGSSGYEEAAAQGIMAGINAALKHQGRPPFILKRSEAYIGVLIDDLVTKGTNEPYRLLTSRSEYRLLLRQDNADLRLTEKGREIGLVDDDRWQKFCSKKQQLEDEMQRLQKTMIVPEQAVNDYLSAHASAQLKSGITAAELLKRPEISYKDLLQIGLTDLDLAEPVIEQAEIQIKYEGYIQKQLQQVAKFNRLEEKPIPAGIDYDQLKGLRIEARQKLSAIRPQYIGQASRISGVSPADISILLIYLEQHK